MIEDQISVKCSCGATLDVTSSSFSFLQDRYEKFLSTHEVCLQKMTDKDLQDKVINIVTHSYNDGVLRRALIRQVKELDNDLSTMQNRT